MTSPRGRPPKGCRRCACGRPLGRRRQKCDTCVREAKRKQTAERSAAHGERRSRECGPVRHDQEERLARYAARAALGLPLFEGEVTG
jgi:hypothetical protein